MDATARPSIQKVMMTIARTMSERSTCARRQVGCVLVNGRNHVLSTGYNGVPSGMRHCKGDQPCPGASLPSGTGLDACEALHAEQNALLQCKDVYDIAYVFCTTAPCVTCTKLLLNTSAKTIYFDESYPHEAAARNLWLRAGRAWVKFVV